MNEILVKVKNNRGDELVGRYHRGYNHQLVVITHGFLVNKDHPSLVSIARRLHALGFSTYRFDFTGCGESGGSWSFSVKQQVEDIKRVVQSFSQYRHVILIGGSYSALPAAIAAYEIPQVMSLVNVNGFYGMPPKIWFLRWLHTFLRFIARYWRQIQAEFEYIDLQFKPERINIPVLLLCSSMDDIIDVNDSSAFYQALKTKKKMVYLPEADHEVTREDMLDKAIRVFMRWNAHIRGSSY